MRGEDDVGDMVDGHVTIDALVGELSGHDASSRIQHQRVDVIRQLPDLLRRIDGRLPVGELDGNIVEASGFVFAEFLRDLLSSVLVVLLRWGECDDFGGVVLEIGVDAAVADALRAYAVVSARSRKGSMRTSGDDKDLVCAHRQLPLHLTQRETHPSSQGPSRWRIAVDQTPPWCDRPPLRQSFQRVSSWRSS